VQWVPENARKEGSIELVISFFLSEYDRFSKTIKRGELKLAQMLKENDGRTLSGFQIVCLEKQWGMPSLLIAMVLKELGLSFQESEYTTTLSVTYETKEILAIGR
jgi:alanyl-tRNA synthetase